MVVDFLDDSSEVSDRVSGNIDLSLAQKYVARGRSDWAELATVKFRRTPDSRIVILGRIRHDHTGSIE